MSELVLTRQDLADEEVRKDCLHEMRRAEAAGPEACAEWLRRWGGALGALFEEIDAGSADLGGDLGEVYR